jgi:OOP family OmpA-OmpF porin
MPASVPERRRLSYQAASMFGFDFSDGLAEGRQKLDRFAAELEDTRCDTVKVEGHTDRVGSAAYNQALSLRCAETVKHDVVTSGRMDPARISALGLGQTRPVTRPADCVAKQRSPALLKCLQLDRRVEIEAVGTR